MTENLKLKHDWKTLMSYWKLKPMTENSNPWLKTQTYEWKATGGIAENSIPETHDWKHAKFAIESIFQSELLRYFFFSFAMPSLKFGYTLQYFEYVKFITAYS